VLQPQPVRAGPAGPEPVRDGGVIREAHAIQGRVLLVDDEPTPLGLAKEILSTAGHVIETARSGDEALTRLKGSMFDLVVTDLVMPGMSGLDLLRRIGESWPDIAVIILTGHADVSTAVSAIREGAENYITKPFDVDRFRLDVQRALERKALRDDNLRLRRVVGERRSFLGSLIGASDAMQAVYDLVEAVAPTNGTVLLLGESGTGKEVTAREIHRRSNRHDAPFIAVNCAALPANLLESELFGHVRGAFTGAAANKVGLFEAAHHGTIFLDEIGATTPQLQQSLLRVLQEREVRRVGDLLPRAIDVRVISATNADLDREMEQGTFRSDLYFRLSGVIVRLPPLRQRLDDLPLLAESLLTQIAKRHGRKPMLLAARAVTRLQGHSWPGNVRELENVLERAVILAKHQTLGPADLELPQAVDAVPPPPAGDLSLEQVIRAHVLGVLDKCGGNKMQAAKLLRVPRSSLYALLQKYGIR
jgi:DNA-binding NtrC family response regulator